MVAGVDCGRDEGCGFGICSCNGQEIGAYARLANVFIF